MTKAAGHLSCLTALAGHVVCSLWVLVALFIEDAEVGGIFKGVELALLRGVSFWWLDYSFLIALPLGF